MSAKWLCTVLAISISLKETCSSSHRISALLRVRFVVPKQGMVTASTSRAGRPSCFMARTATSSARQLSKPPEMPMTAVLAWA
jgi:hypothetical protein